MPLTDIERARELLKSDPSLTAVAVRGDKVLTTDKKGIRPLVEWLDSGDMAGFSAADKAGGRAAAMLYDLMGIEEVYFIRASRHCMDYLIGKGIKAACGDTVEYILNRDRSGMCPMEELSLTTDDPSGFLEKARGKLSIKR